MTIVINFHSEYRSCAANLYKIFNSNGKNLICWILIRDRFIFMVKRSSYYRSLAHDSQLPVKNNHYNMPYGSTCYKTDIVEGSIGFNGFSHRHEFPLEPRNILEWRTNFLDSCLYNSNNFLPIKHNFLLNNQSLQKASGFQELLQMIKPDIHMGNYLKSEILSQQIKRNIPSNSLNQEKATNIQLICIARTKLRHRPQQLRFLYVIWLLEYFPKEKPREYHSPTWQCLIQLSDGPISGLPMLF
jgi:hypothetical protein